MFMVSHQKFVVFFTAPSIPVAHRQRVCEDFSKVDTSPPGHDPIGDDVSVAGVHCHLLKLATVHLLALSSRPELHLSELQSLKIVLGNLC